MNWQDFAGWGARLADWGADCHQGLRNRPARAQTSPAATEMEMRMLDWLRQAVGLPEGFSGVIQDGESSATLAAVLVMRERALEWHGNAEGLPGQRRLRVYASAQVHSSTDRAIWIAGIGAENLVRIPTRGPLRRMDAQALSAALAADRAAGYLPAGVIVCTGGTGVGGSDDVAAVVSVARAEGLRRTLAIRPEYLHTAGQEQVSDYSEISIPLGRRFRALAGRLAAEPDFHIASAPVLALFAFRHVPPGAGDLDALDDRLLQAMNDDGRIDLTPTILDGRKVIRFQVGQFEAEERDVDTAFEVIPEIARSLERGTA